MPEPSMSSEYMLIASIAALFVGPVIHRLAGRDVRAYSLFDGLVVVAVLGLALLEIVPLGFELAGWPALLAVLAGVLLPNLAERRFGGKSTHRVAAWAAFVGMAFHAFTDGLALVVGGHVHAGHAIEWAVVLHRIPVGLAVWWMLTSSDRADKSGQRAGIIALATISVATVAGYLLGGTTRVLDDSRVVGLFAAFVGGLLLHVVSHGIGSAHSRQEQRYWPGVGGLLGLAAVIAWVVVPATREGQGQATLDAFWNLLLESAPALVIAYGVAGLIGSVMGEAPARWLRRGGPTTQALRGVVFGLPLPLCSCGVVPVYRSLVDRRVPATAALAFLVATPELGLDAVLLSVPLLGIEMALLRVGVAFVLALFVGAAVGGWVERREARARERAGADPAVEAPVEPAVQKPLQARLLAGLRSGYGEVLDSTGPWILVGLLLAAFIQPWIDPGFFTKLGPMLQVVAFGLLGLPVYVCATGATPLVAVLIATGLSPGAGLAFLLTGPATNATTFGVLEQLHGRKVALAFAGAMIVAVLGLGWGVNLIWPGAGAGAGVAHAHADAHGPIAIASAVLLGALFVVSLIRQGPRGFLGRLWELGGHEHDDHDDHDHDDHGHDHDHDHEKPARPDTCCGGH
jgi:uncharacterized membrane protein YraQ (UPF0718 family)